MRCMQLHWEKAQQPGTRYTPSSRLDPARCTRNKPRFDRRNRSRCSALHSTVCTCMYQRCLQRKVTNQQPTLQPCPMSQISRVYLQKTNVFQIHVVDPGNPQSSTAVL